MNYETLLKNAPAHDTEAFIDYLREHNPVYWENPQWIVIENVKYHTKKKPWYTAFWKGTWSGHHDWYEDIDILWYEFGHLEWLKKAKEKQTVGRFHIHLMEGDKHDAPHAGFGSATGDRSTLAEGEKST